MTIRFTVLGKPVAQGSMVPVRSRNPGESRIFLKASNEAELRKWRRRIVDAARLAAGGRCAAKDVPVTVRAVFRMPRPATMPKGRTMPTVPPDADKLLRAGLDALTQAQVYRDDSQVVDAHAVKLYATPAHPPGMYAEVEFHEPEVLL